VNTASASGTVAREGEVAWEELYARLRPTLVRALAATAGSYEGVEDAIQEAFADAMHKRPAELRSPEGWLYAVALNKLRGARRRAAVLAHLRLSPPPSSHDLDDALRRIDVTRTLLELGERDRALLVAKHYVGMTQQEIARHLGVPRGTVSAAISRAAARFRQLEARRGQSD
jgi:RNA polymerase sigma-70 factor (ECF subfamily)